MSQDIPQQKLSLPATDLLEPTVLQSNSPVERAVIQLLFLSETQGMDPSVLLNQLSKDCSHLTRLSIAGLANDLATGVALPDAIRRSADLISPENALAIQLATDTNSTQWVFSEILGSSEFAGENWGSQNLGSNLFSAVTRLLFCIFLMTGVMLLVLPTFEILFHEFELRLPAPTLLLFELSNAVALYFPRVMMVLFGLLAVFVFIRLRRWIRIVSSRGINIMAWRKTWVPELTRLLPLLAVAARFNTTGQAIETLAEHHPSARVRGKLQRTLLGIQQGKETFAAMRDCGLLSKREASSLALARSGPTQAWLLRWSASRRQSRRFFWSGLLMRFFSVVVVSSVAVLTFMAAIGVFMPLFALIQALAS